MSQYTLGPWTVCYQEGDKPYIVADQGKKWNNPVVCNLYDDVTPEDSVTIGPWLEAHDNAAANARLIAAAPELLAIVQRFIERDPRTTQLSEDAKAIVAKATGEQT